MKIAETKRGKKTDTRQTSINLKPHVLLTNRAAFTLDEFAQLVGLSYTTAWRLYQRGKIKRCGYSRNILISRAEVERFTRDQEAA